MARHVLRECGHGFTNYTENLRQPDWVKCGSVLAFSQKTALGSRSGPGAFGIARKPARPLSTPSRPAAYLFLDISAF